MQRLLIYDPPSDSLAAHAHLDVLRGLAALAVVFGHARLALVMDTADVPDLHVWQRPFYFLTSLGPHSVMIFFVLSGFLVGSSAMRSIVRDEWSWPKYLIARGSRIYTVLLPALIIGMCVDLAGSHIFANSPIYFENGYNVMLPHRISSMISPTIFFGNLLNIQDMYVQTLGSNHPLWSLSYEWWYYILFPLICCLFANRKNRIRLVYYLILSIFVLAFITQPVRELFIVWLMGAAISLIRPIVGKNYYIIAILTILALLLVGSSLKVFGPFWDIFSPYIIGATTALLIYFIRCNAAVLKNGTYRNISIFFSKISFTLYVTHMPIIVLMTAIILPMRPKMMPNVQGILITLGLVCAAVIYATIMWLLFERQTGMVRRAMTSFIGVRTPVK